MTPDQDTSSMDTSHDDEDLDRDWDTEAAQEYMMTLFEHGLEPTG